MTPYGKSILCDLVKNKIADLQEEERELREVLMELQNEQSATNGASLHKPTAPADVKTVQTSTLEIRLEQLREQHGPVFIIDPKNPVAAGQRIKWGKAGSEKTVEVLETAELPGKDGTVVPARYFAKLVDV